MLAFGDNVIGQFLKGHFYVAKMRGATSRSEVATLLMILHLCQWRFNYTTLSVEPATVINIFENRFGEK